ncbi:Tyrosine--tRNA ligase [Candidatus Magnetomoraceae bacterium gMMP-15]
MDNVFNEFKERGFIEQTTHKEELYSLLENEKIICYIGFDPTASSLHVGSLIPIMSLAHMQRHGHQPIALVGGGTGLVGDPSGKTEMRQMLTSERVEENVRAIKKQLSNFIDFKDDKALLLNNAEWLTKLEYIPFLRDVGRHFSINRMIKAESYKMRMESEEGLNFIEFNYMLLQSYDFLRLFSDYGCVLQMGGSDQWGNIVSGVELIRRTCHKTAFGITFPLITTSTGAKMGKTAKGAVWLDSKLTSPYDYYQFWINTDDRDVARFLAFFTFLPVDEINNVENLKDADLNLAKTVLAFEATLLAHGMEEAVKAFYAASRMFGNRVVPSDMLPSSQIPRNTLKAEDSSVPSSYINEAALSKEIPAFKLFHSIGLCNSGGAARRLIEQGGAYINGQRIEAFDEKININNMQEGEILLRAGKKKYHKLLLK